VARGAGSFLGFSQKMGTKNGDTLDFHHFFSFPLFHFFVIEMAAVQRLMNCYVKDSQTGFSRLAAPGDSAWQSKTEGLF